MAESPGVYTTEKDQTFAIQSLQSNSTGYVMTSRWGPVEQIVEITTNENELVQRFGTPDTTTSQSFHAAANYLLYSVPLHVVRAVGDAAKNSITADAKTATKPALLIKNVDAADDLDLDGYSFVARYPGQLGNSLKVSVANSAGVGTWEYSDLFEYLPTDTATFNVVVVDRTGLITGTAGTILERYSLLNNTAGSIKTDGTAAYLPDVIKSQSNWLLVGDETSITFTSGIYSQEFVDGVDDNDAANVDYISAWNLFGNKESSDIIRTFSSFSSLEGANRAIDLMDSREDAVAFHACRLEDVYNNVNQVSNLTTYFGTTVNKPSSYAFQVDNWKLVYDNYNRRNIWIPTDSDAAGLHARTFVTAAPWMSMAGLNRGVLKNVIRLAWSSDQKQRDVLYKNSINSIVSFKGEGNVLWGDKTALMAPSAFSRINVRTLFIVLKKNISSSARYQLFELNDFVTRSLFRNATNRYLTGVQGGRGVQSFQVVCDETNNTAAVIDANEFVGDVKVKPSRSINVIRLNFVAVATGVDFTEVEG